MNSEINLEHKPEGIVLVDKQADWTSFNVVSKIRGLLKVKKVGHAGTLDPFATGLLIILVGKKYTKMAEQFTGQNKTYEATIKLGEQTDTDDTEGQVIKKLDDFDVDPNKVHLVLEKFKGKIQQRPPNFSAISIGGQRSYKRARNGEVFEIPKREIEVFELELMSLDLEKFELKIRTKVSKGTYIRAMARDIGEALGVPAHLNQLRRTASGDFKIEDAQIVIKETKPEEIKLISIGHLE